MNLTSYATNLSINMEDYNKTIEKYLTTCNSWNCYYFYEKDLKEINKQSEIYKVEHIPGTYKKAYTIKHIPTGSVLVYSYNTLVLAYIKTSEYNFIDIGYYSNTTNTHIQQAINMYDLKLKDPLYCITPEHPQGQKYYNHNKFLDTIYYQNRKDRGTYNYTLTPVTLDGVISSTKEQQFIYYNNNIEHYYYIDIDTLEETYKPIEFKVPDKIIIQNHYKKHELNKRISLNELYQTVTKIKNILGYYYHKDTLLKIFNDMTDPVDVSTYNLLKTYLENNKLYKWQLEDIQHNIKNTLLENSEVLNYATTY